jgi:hypothetical protein
MHKLTFSKIWPYISIALLLALIFSLIYYPTAAGILGAILLFGGLGVAIFSIIQKHLRMYREGKQTFTKATINILLDILGLLLVIFTASYLGGLAGTWASQYGLYLGLAAGVLAGFLSAWGVRNVWKLFSHTGEMA